MTVIEFSNKHYQAFEDVCEKLDIRVKGCGHYEHVAKNYGIKGHTIRSRLEKDAGGASKAMFENLACRIPELTLGELFLVLKENKRKDVILAFSG